MIDILGIITIDEGILGQAIVTLIIYGLFMLLTKPITNYNIKQVTKDKKP